MTKQEQIDKICKWMGWERIWAKWEPTGSGISSDLFPCYKTTKGAVQYWVPKDKPLHFAHAITFDPFTNPSDCARVMDEARSRDMAFRLVVMKKEVRCHFPQTNQPTIVGCATEWMEAFCLALLEAFGKE